jgi:GxxExxY protein
MNQNRQVDELGDRYQEAELTKQIIGAAIEVHRALGAGLLEATYHSCLARELSIRGVPFDQEVPLPIEYKGVRLDCGYRMDIVVADKVVVELKAVEQLLPLHEAQLLTYLKLSALRIGLLINFNVPALKDGIKRRVL